MCKKPNPMALAQFDYLLGRTVGAIFFWTQHMPEEERKDLISRMHAIRRQIMGSFNPEYSTKPFDDEVDELFEGLIKTENGVRILERRDKNDE